MPDFDETQPIQAKVSWVGAELSLTKVVRTPEGLQAETPTQGAPGGTTRWLIPWASVVYLKQDIPPPTNPAPEDPRPRLH